MLDIEGVDIVSDMLLNFLVSSSLLVDWIMRLGKVSILKIPESIESVFGKMVGFDCILTRHHKALYHQTKKMLE